MSDIALRLTDQHAPQNLSVALREAAAEIERLRAALEMFACDCKKGETPCSIPTNCRNYIARAALEDGNG